jgi:hypothetical protein
VDITPVADAEAALAKLDLEDASDIAEELWREFRFASSYARCFIPATMPHEAEDGGVAMVDTAVAWLTTRGRYGMALLPSGEAQDFARQEGLRPPERGSVVLIYGLQTKRQWLRWPQGARSSVERDLSVQSSFLEPNLPSTLTVRDRQALLALHRAATETDPLSQVQALSEAIEAYVAGTKVESKLFPPARLKALRQAIPGDLSPQQRERLDEAIGRLNSPPLRTRLGVRLRHDGVPVSEAELKSLKDLRDARNTSVHGDHVADLPTREAINVGISLVARMLVYRIASLARD